MNINPLSVLQVFIGGGTESDRLVIQSFRLPRIIVALLVGMGLAVAGGILQGMIRNPLASPDILGITGGATVAVVGFLAIFSDKNHSLTVSINWMPLSCIYWGDSCGIPCLFLSLEKWSFPDKACIDRDWDDGFNEGPHYDDDDSWPNLSSEPGKPLDYGISVDLHLE